MGFVRGAKLRKKVIEKDIPLLKRIAQKKHVKMNFNENCRFSEGFEGKVGQKVRKIVILREIIK
ncbi:hypothetical protein BH11BAC7_BH11BAC7_24900 [soil metagenome]